MVINVNIKYAENELKSLKYASSYILDKTKLSLSDVPTLIIGVGGTGVAAITKIKHEYERNYHKSDRLHFLGIDTDGGSLERNTVEDEVAKTTLSEIKNEWIGLESGVGKQMEEDHKWPEVIKDFAPKKSGINPPPHGAGGYRVASRFIFFRNIGTIIQKLELIFNKILSGAQRQAGHQALNVLIVTGIAGGTGSGASLDIAYLIRAMLKKKYGYDAGTLDYIQNGYIVLPDVNDSVKTNVYNHSNGYAYLKELDYFNSLKTHDETFRQEYASYIYEGKDAPFDLTFTFSAKDTDGNLIAAAFEKATVNIAESVLDFLSDGSQGETFIKSLTSNINAALDGHVHNRADVEHSRYVSFGNASFRLPRRELTQYLSARLFELLNSPDNPDEDHKLFENAPTSPEQVAIFERLKIDYEEAVKAWKSLYEPGNKFAYNDWHNQLKGNYSYDKVLVTKETKVEGELHDDIIKHLRDHLTAYTTREKSLLISNAESVLDELLTDRRQGPLYISRLFGDSTLAGSHAQGQSVSEHISWFRNTLAQDIRVLNDKLEFARKAKQSAQAETPKGGPLGWGLEKAKEDIVRRYITACIEEVEALKDKTALEALSDFMKKAGEDLEDIYNTKYGPISHILMDMRETGRDFMANSLPGLKERDGESLERYTKVYSFVKFDDLITSVEKNVIANKDLARLKTDFLGNLAANRMKLLDNNKPEIKGFIQGFLEDYMVKDLGDSFFRIIKWAANVRKNATVNDSFEDVADLTADEVGLDDFIQQVVLAKLRTESQVSVRLKSALGQYENTIKLEMSLKEALVPNVSDELEKSLSSTGEFVVTPVSRGDSLSAYHFVFGFPLYMLPDIGSYEMAYEQALSHRTPYAKSLHIFNSETVKFEDLPSIIPQIERDDTTKVRPRIDQKWAERQALYEACLELGFIQTEANGDVYLRFNDRKIPLEGAGDKPALHFQKLYQPIKELEEQIKSYQQQQAGQLLSYLLATGLVANDPGTFVYYVKLLDHRIELGNLISNKDFVELSLQQRLDETLDQEQKDLLYKEAKEQFEALTKTAQGVEQWETFRAEFARRIDDVEKLLIVKKPLNADELRAFYGSLKQVL